MIPPQLQRPEIRFIKIRADNRKVPLEQDWVNKANYPHTSQDIIQWIEAGNNYGVATGYGDLVVVDSDTPKLADWVEQNLPPTFTVKTGGGGIHNYYICKDMEKIVLDNGSHLGEIQAKGQQVIGPGSTHPNGNKYRVVKDIPITVITKNELLEKIPTEWYKKKKQTHQQHTQHDIQIDLRDIIPLTGLQEKPSGEYQGPHPIHGSENTGANFTLNPDKNVWYCFRHNGGGGPLEWIGQQEGLISCGDTLSKDKFRKVMALAKEKYGLRDIREQESLAAAQQKDYTTIKLQILQALAAKDRSHATEIMTKVLEQEEHIYTIRSDDTQEIWIYQDGIYKPDGVTYIKEKIRTILGDQYTTTYANQVIDKVMIDNYVNSEDFFSHNIKDKIVVENGILDLNNYKLLPYNPDEIFFSKLPIKYNPNQDCPLIKQFFKEILKNREDLPVIQEVFGSFLYKEYFIEKAVMLVGTGRNGKGKTLELMKRFLGPDNVTSVPLQQMDTDMYSISELHNKLANLAGDLDNNALKHTGRFKELTGRDTISVARKFKTRLHFVNYAKMVFAANELPKTYDLSPAFFMRWVILEFPYTFLKQEEIDEITDAKELSHIKLRDPEKVDKISGPEELSGLLNWAIDGLKRLREQKDFSYNKSVDDIRNIWFRKSDSFTAFCMDHLKEKYGSVMDKSELRHVYHQYCKRHDLKPVNDKELKETLVRQFGAWDQQVNDGDGGKIRQWVGVEYQEINNKQVSL